MFMLYPGYRAYRPLTQRPALVVVAAAVIVNFFFLFLLKPQRNFDLIAVSEWSPRGFDGHDGGIYVRLFVFCSPVAAFFCFFFPVCSFLFCDLGPKHTYRREVRQCCGIAGCCVVGHVLWYDTSYDMMIYDVL